MSTRSALLVIPAALAALALVASATGANRPGDPCTVEGAFADLNGGKIKCVGGTWQPSTGAGPTQPGGPASSTSSVKTAAIFKKVGIALSAATFASDGKQVADVTAVRLANGRVRLYAFVAPGGIRSALSTDASGTKFVADPGVRIPWAPGGQTRAIAVGGGVRLFYLDGGSIKSALSSDGLTFTDEGVRITTDEAGFEPGGLSVVKVAGGYRGYFSNLEKPGARATRVARTATSPDMLRWTVGPYVAGPAGSIANGASHPFAIASGKTIALYYNGDRGSFYGLLRSTSTDGVTFKNERAIMKTAGDPQLLALPGKTLLYYGEKVGTGFGVAVARTTVNPVTGQGAGPAKK